MIAWPGALLGLLFIGSGLFIDDTVQWRLNLLAGLWLLSLPPRALLAQRSPVVTRGLSRIALVLGLGFCAVALQMTRNQITQAPDIRTRAAAIFEPTPVPTEVVLPGVSEDPAVVPTPIGIRAADRTELGTERVWPVEVERDRRGLIFDRNGVLLAGTQNGRRYYPFPNLGQIVGFDSRLYGKSGIEATFDTYLSGEHSLQVHEMLEGRLLETSTITTTAADLTLTLDVNLQQAAQNALGNRAGAVVLLDPNTGAVLALASYPRFDPNQFVLPPQATDADVAAIEAAWQAIANRADSPLINRATQGRYPPGSIIKTLTAAAAIDSGVLPFPESPITCPNRFSTGEVGAPPVRNAVEGLAGRTGNPSTLRRVYAWSCNTAFAQIGLMLGTETFSDYANRFGLMFVGDDVQPALRDVAADVSTIAGERAFLQRPIALADTAFGQGQILTTPLDMAQMAAIIANGGKLMRPYVVQEARVDTQVVYRAQPEALRQVISPESARQMRSIMQSSVENGYASPAAIRGIKVGGKTGTAEIPGGVPHSWFVAIAPVEQPRFAIAVIVERGGEGSQTALPVARQVLLAALQR